MSECLINFTKKAKLDEDFMLFYDQLWEETPHFNSNWPSQEEISKNKENGKQIYNNPKPERLPDEVWDNLPGNEKYLVSGHSSYEDGSYMSKFINYSKALKVLEVE